MSWQEACGPYVGVAELKRRGWTPKMITELLGEPDQTESNPGGRNSPRVMLWIFTRVEEIEETDAFRERWWKAFERRKAQQRPTPEANTDCDTSGA